MTKTDKKKQQFIANMSHEMRTPLSGIIGIIELIEKTELNEKQKEFVEIIKDSSNNLLTIVNNMLDISKIEAEKLTIEMHSFNFHKAIFNATNLFKGFIESKNLNLNLTIDDDIPEFLKSDEYRIKQVINNLVSNAIKFTNQGSITINVLKEKETEDGNLIIKISVIDTGIGISQVNYKLLFEKYSKVDSSSSNKYEGAGLGLSIVKDIVNMLGGKVGVESKVGEGSNFWFTFKAEKSNYQNKANDENLSKLAQIKDSSYNVLVVEDKFVNSKILQLMLENIACTVDIAENGIIAIEKIQKNKYNLIFMDIMMPVMDGIIATKKIKEQIENPPPIIGLSANAMEGDAEKYKKLGMDDYITKPVLQEVLIQIIIKHLLKD